MDQREETCGDQVIKVIVFKKEMILKMPPPAHPTGADQVFTWQKQVDLMATTKLCVRSFFLLECLHG